jgi:hypothetical protein
MNTTPPSVAIHSSADLEGLWSSLLGSDGFSGRSLWLALLDSNSRVQPTLVPFDDFPVVPDREMLRNLRGIIDGIVGTMGIASVLLLIARPGSDAMTSQDRLWAALLHTEIGLRYSYWPIHLATRGRIQAFAPDDLIAAA